MCRDGKARWLQLSQPWAIPRLAARVPWNLAALATPAPGPEERCGEAHGLPYPAGRPDPQAHSDGVCPSSDSARVHVQCESADAVRLAARESAWPVHPGARVLGLRGGVGA